MDAAISASFEIHTLDLKETTMTRRLTILAAVTALAVSAGAASAGASIQLAPYLENTMISGHSKTRSSSQTPTRLLESDGLYFVTTAK
jgi:hypothetical protein